MAGDSPLQVAKERLSIPALWHLLALPGKPAKSCRSPFRHEHHPSFSVYLDGRRFHDFVTGKDGDAADFVAFAYSLSAEEGARRLIEMAGVLPRPNERANPGNFVRLPRDDDAEREAKRADWPEFDEPIPAELKQVARLRGLSVAGVSLAAERGFPMVRGLARGAGVGCHGLPAQERANSTAGRSALGAHRR